MTALRISREVSIGSMVSIIVVVLGFSASFVTTQNATKANAAAITRTDTEVSGLKAELGDMRERHEASREAAMAKQIELTRSIATMQADVRYLREAIDKLTAATAAGGAK